MEIANLVEERKSCFTENYLVFTLNEKMPQITSTYLDREDEVLDYCKTVNFNRNARRMEFIMNKNNDYFDGVFDSSQNLPDEIDDDERGSIFAERRTFVSRGGVESERSDSFAVDQSMFIEELD